MTNRFDFQAAGKRVANIESAASQALAERIDASFSNACELIMGCAGRVIVTGMGKSGHIGGKIAATFASTGTPAFFVHPGEASHGDLGMITGNDLVIAISNSGKTAELISILPLIKRKGAHLISMTGNPQSELAQLADVNLDISVAKEACPLNLAPTASTTVTLVMGDALAVALLEARGFTANDFALSHPGGSLGRKLLLKVADIMHMGDALPQVTSGTSIKDALLEMTRKGLGMTAIVNSAGGLMGIFTDGDLRRVLDRDLDVKSTLIDTVMSTRVKTVTQDTLAAAALKQMEDSAINGLLVVNEQQQPIGAFNMQDLLKAGVI